MRMSPINGRIGRLAGCTGIVAVLLVGSAALAEPQVLLVNAKVFTADPTLPYAQAVAVEGGRILAVGSNEAVRALAGPDTRIIDAGGRLVTPGLIEAHVHLGTELPTPPLAMPNLPFPGPTPEQALAVLEEAARTRRDWITAYVGPLVARDRRNWRKALDTVAPETPVFLRGSWGAHTSILNSEGLRRLGIAEDTADPLGGWWGRDESGRLDGRAYEAAETMTPLIRPATAERLAMSFGEAQKRYARWGVTSIHLMNNDKSLAVTLAALATAKPLQKWTVYSWGTWQTQRIPDAWAVIDAAVKQAPAKVRVEGPKWMLDGTPIEQNSFQRAAYNGRPGWRGRSNFTDQQLREILQLALERPTQLALHVVGDAESDRLLNLMEQLAPASTWRAKRVRIEHGDGIGPDAFQRVAGLGLAVIQNPTHLAPPPIEGKKMLDHDLVLKSFINAGIPLALGSDAGPKEQNPFLNLMLAVLGPGDRAEALTREQALTAYTAGGAYAEGEEQRKGRLAPGFSADIAVLSQDVLTIPAPQLPATTSLLTMVDGEVIFTDAMFATSN
ncbi:amidohydrolase [Bradyrhizobium diazoefficiens]|uniref:amidohydrolase n=1 Tax=Bradyrhizobium diazoefficiens TaxID=1355477 RepID=UPI00190D359B|nr:amidohydrolase [Bradyrhizobium diazoefficiens]QQO35968.1 amidohydrolase [Bradyrhizobium diazoefficiens]